MKNGETVRKKRPLSSSTIRAYSALLRGYLATGVPPTLDTVARAARLAGRSSARTAMLALERYGLVRNVRGMYVPTDVLRIPPRCPRCSTPLTVSVPQDGQPTWACPSCPHRTGHTHRRGAP